MKKLRNNKIRKLLAFMVALALMVSCMPSAYTISASEAFGDGTEDIFTDGEFTSEPAAEESTPDVSSADQEETEQAQQSTLTYENDSVKVTAEALEDGALPQNTALKADSVNENSSVSYDTVSQKLSVAATDKGSSLRGFFAYDVYFADGDGNRVEPNGRVRVTFEYKTPAAPELTDAASTSVTVEKLHYNSSTGDTDVNTLQANEDLKVLNVNEGKQIQTLQVETGNAAVFAVMWDSPETADVEAEAVSGNGDEVSIASEELTDGMDISDEPEQDAAETPAAENPEVTPEAEPSEEPAVEPTEAPAENPDAEPTEAPAEDQDVVEEPAEDIESPDEVPAADENGETSLIEVLGDDTNLRVSPSTEAEVLATVNAGTQLTLLDTVTAEDGATWYKVSWEGTEAYIRSDMAQVVDSSDEAEEVEDVLESEEVSYSQEVGDVVVTATAAKDVIPEGAQFVVTPIEKGSDQYEDVADRLEKKAENEDYSIAGFLAYDIYFQDSEGNKINPEDGKVKVSMEYQNATAPDEVKEADAATMAMASADESNQDDTETAEQNLSVSVMHFVEDKDGNVTEVVNMSNEGQAEVNTTDNGEIKKAEFETDSFSIFSVVWQSADEFVSTQASSGSFSKLTNTVDNIKDGITLNLFDYDTKPISNGHALEFNTGRGNSFNKWTGDLTSQKDANGNTFSSNRDTAKVTPYQGIMNKQLGKDSDGNYTYPTIKVGNSNESSSYLFSTAKGTGKTVYSNVNKLFTKDSDGYYEYNSETNFAQYNNQLKSFDVYNVPGSSQNAVGNTDTGKHGSFFPFNTLTSTLISNTSINAISGSANYHFGMTMESNFLQPEGGKVNGNPMKFEFSGDDDVWVYVDGVLVLDIGGIHNAISGTIDFATGEVTVGNQTSTTLKQLFLDAGVSTSDFNEDNGTFADYTGHTINFYYLERGAGASNCHLKFNLTTMPEGTVAVEKQLSNTDKEKYTNVEFKFQLLAQKVISQDKTTGKETYSDEYEPIESNAVLNDGTPVTFKAEKIGDKKYKGVFKLKPGQHATFSGLKKNRKYKVQEIGVSSAEYDHIYVNKVEVTDTNGNITSGEATVASRPLVRFTNNCSAANSRELRITKQIKNNIAVKDTFKFKVWLNGQEYTGDYYLKDSSGNYYTINANGILNSHGSSSTVCGTAENGVISSIPAGYTVSITQILSGTTFKVEEEELSSDYGTPEYKVDETTAIVNEDSEVAEGTIELNKDAQVTVTNVLASVAELDFKKVNTKGEALSGAEFTLTSQDDNSKTYTAESGDDGIIKFENLPLGTYTLTETKVPNNYENRNTWIVKVEKDEAGTAVATLYEADGKTVVEKDSKDSYYHIVNYTHQELVESDVEYSKTAHVTNWENRTYKIDISAESKSRSQSTVVTGAADIMLVLDVSGSMNNVIYEKVADNTKEGRNSLNFDNTDYYLKYNDTYYKITKSGNNYYIYSNYGWQYDISDSWYENCGIFTKTTRLDALKESVKQFINSTAEKSSNSKIGIATFSWNKQGTITDLLELELENNKDTLIKTVNGLNADGGTDPDFGLSNAYDKLTEATEKGDTLPKYVILFTDGEPTGNYSDSSQGASWSTAAQKRAEATAKKLKDNGVSIYTIGFALTERAETFLAGGSYESTDYPGIASNTECAKTADDAAGLSELFRTFEQTIFNDVDITNATITDTIDPRFDLLDDAGKIITEESLANGSLTLANGGVVSWVNGNLQVQWTNVTIPNTNKKNNNPWTKSLNIKAKDTYIGGNDVTTNVRDGSNITFGNEKIYLPQPKVNVNAKIFINDKEITIYKGDPIPTNREIQDKLFKASDVTSYEYGKVGTADIDKIQLKWYKDPECTKPIATDTDGNPVYDLRQLSDTDKQPTADTKYYLKVTYDAGVPSKESNENTDSKVAGGEDNIQEAIKKNSNNPYGIYTINVISGQIDIIKKVNEKSSESRTFQFEVTKTENGKPKAIEGSPFTVIVPANSDTGTVSDAKEKAKLSNLSRGTYVVSEVVPNGYRITATDVKGTNCQKSVEENKTKFILGNGIDTASDVISTNYTYNPDDGGVLGKVSYTNEYSVNLDLKKVDSSGNNELSGAEFTLEVKDGTTGQFDGNAYNPFEIEKDTVELKNLKPGLYKLTEIKAPKGYSLLGTSIYFQVRLGKVTLVKEDGTPIEVQSQSMWTLDEDRNVLTIKNTKLYSLPESGGPGTYGFTISGVAILATALLLFINNKRREEEAKRS